MKRMQATDPRLVQLAVVMAVEDSKMVNHCHTRPLIAGQGGATGTFFPGPHTYRGPKLQTTLYEAYNFNFNFLQIK